MSTIKTILSVLAIVGGYGLVGRMDYEDAVIMENAYRAPAQTDCPNAVSDSSPYPLQNVRDTRAGISDEATTGPADVCDVQRD
jgi:hypothetical protein